MGQKEIEAHSLDEYKICTRDSNGAGEQELSLMSFNFQLNQILMLINNPMLFPHLDYVDMFNGFGQKEESDSE